MDIKILKILSSFKYLLIYLICVAMGRKCCVMNCNGNYDAENKESTFRLPADEG